MSGTSNDRLPLSTGKKSDALSDIDLWKWTSEEQHLSRATQIYVALQRLDSTYVFHYADSIRRTKVNEDFSQNP